MLRPPTNAQDHHLEMALEQVDLAHVTNLILSRIGVNPFPLLERGTSPIDFDARLGSLPAG